MTRTMLAVFAMSMAFSTQAATLNKEQQVSFNILKKELLASQCVVQKDAKAYSTKSTEYGLVTVITVSAEGCGGGNNWGTYYQVFYNDGKNHLPSGSLPVIDKVSVHENVIRFQSTEYADDAPRCCPSLKKETTFKIEGNKLVPVKNY